MTLYLDTSVLVCALTNEADTSRILSWLSAQTPGECAVSDWVVAELSSALSIKIRTGEITSSERATALAAFASLVAASFDVVAIEPADFHRAARLADQHALGLRAGDALHAAICARHGATLCTLDRQLATAGAAAGVSTRAL